jgi:hypothetical protein
MAGKLSTSTPKFLRFISSADDLRYFVVKAPSPGNFRSQLGYYQCSNLEKLESDLQQRQDWAIGAYYSLNPVAANCIARAGNELLPATSLLAIRASDIVSRRLLLIHVDPTRAPDISATNEEKDEALRLAR